MTSDFAELAPGAVLGNRYLIDRVVPSDSGSAYFGRQLETGSEIQLLELPPISLGPLRRALGVRHPTLCALLDVVPHPAGHGVAVFEHIRGRTLEQALKRRRVLPASQAVTAALDVADALTAMHHRGAAHGLVRPAAIVIEPEGRAGAILSYAPLSPSPSPYHCPERGIGAPSPTDDVWALAAILHQMLIGEPPPSVGYRSKREVEAKGISDPALATVLANCLARRPENRISMVQPVRDLLVSHFERTTGDPPVLLARPELPEPGVEPSSEPPRPEPVLSGPESAAPKQPRGLLLGAAIGSLVVAAALGVSTMLTRASPGSAGAAPSASVARAEARTVAEAAPAADTPLDLVSADSLPSEEDLAACVAAQLPPGTFHDRPRVDFICSTNNPRMGFERMRAALVLGAGRGNLTQAMSIWARLQWYGMAAYAVIRGACCPGAEPLDPPKSARCPSLAGPLAELGTLAIASEGWEAALAEYTKAIRCRSAKGQEAVYGVDVPLGGGQESALRELIRAGSGR